MKFGYTIVYVQSPERSLTLYERAFGLRRRFLHESGQYGELDTGETTLAFTSLELAASNVPDGVERLDPKGRPAAVELAFVTEDVHAAYERAVQAGAVGYVAPKAKPWGQIVGYVRDGDGTLIELCTPIGG